MLKTFNPGHIGIKANFEETLALAQRHGFQAADFPVDAICAIGSNRAASMFAELGLKPGVWNLPFMPYALDASAWQDAVKKLDEQAKAASAAGARRTAMWILPGSDEREFEQNFQYHVERFKPVAETLDRYGVRLGLEFVGPKTSRAKRKHAFVHTLDGALQLARAIGSNVGLLLDSWHWYTSGGTRADLAELNNDLLVHVHVNDAPAGIDREAQIDNQRCLPGTTGVIDIEGFFQALMNASYDGPVTAEPFDKSLHELAPDEAARLNAEALQKVWPR